MIWLASVSKKSAERMWLSRSGLPVSIELRSISAVTVDSGGLAAVTISPLKLVNLPRTLLTIM